MFYRYSLRTTDVDAARRFYAESIGLELPSNMRHVDPEIICLVLVLRPPDLLQKLALGDQAAGASGQRGDESPLDRGETDFFTIDDGSLVLQVDDEVLGRHDRRLVCGLVAS